MGWWQQATEAREHMEKVFDHGYLTVAHHRRATYHHGKGSHGAGLLHNFWTLKNAGETLRHLGHAHRALRRR